VETLCAQEGLDSSMCSVIMTDIRPEEGGDGQGAAGGAGAGPKGRGGRRGEGGGVSGQQQQQQQEEEVHGFKDVEEWVRREAAAFHRTV